MPPKRQKEPERTSLDDWIAEEEERQKHIVVEKTPEQAKKDAEKAKAFAKLNKQQQRNQLAREAEAYRAHMAVKYEIYKQEMREKREREKLLIAERETADFKLMPQRREQLIDSMNAIEKMEMRSRRFESKFVKQNEWELYIACFPLPFPDNVQEMNEYITHWREIVDGATDLDDAVKRSEDVLYFIKILDKFILKPVNVSKEKIALLRQIMEELKILLQRTIDMASYFILRDIATNMHSEDAKIATYIKDTKFFSLALWAQLPAPVPLKEAAETTFPKFSVDFSEVNCIITFPENVDMQNAGIRILKLSYDHMSWQSCGYIDCPNEFLMNMLQYVDDEWSRKQHLKFERRFLEHEENPVVENDDADTYLIMNTNWKYERDIEPVPSDLMDKINAETCENILKSVESYEMSQVVNLRQHIIVGQLGFLNLIVAPPQPQKLMMDVDVTALILPKELVQLPTYKFKQNKKEIENRVFKKLQQSRTFSRVLRDSNINVNEVRSNTLILERSMSFNIDDEDLADMTEEEIRDLRYRNFAKIEIDMPSYAFWLDTPILCNWNDHIKHWTTSTIHGVQFDKDFTKVTFYTPRFGIFALAVRRHCCFPFKDWKLIPTDSKTVTLNLITNLFSFEISAKSNKFYLNKIVGISPEKTKTWGVLRQALDLHEIMEKLRFVGIDIFPTFDTFNYVEESTQKHWVIERHLYYCMAMVSFGYEIIPSKWNLKSGLRKIFFQAREIEANRYNTIYIDQWQAIMIKGQEEDEELDMTSRPGIPFTADFYQLFKHTANYTTRRIVKTIPHELPHSVFELLSAFRPLSFTYNEEPQSETE